MKNKIKILLFIIPPFLILIGFLVYLVTMEDKENLTEDAYKFSTIDFNNTTLDTTKVEPKNIDLIKFYYKDRNNQKFTNIKNLEKQLQGQGEKLIFATNGGIFSTVYDPVGLFIENGRKITEINKSDGEGNFFLKPNGIFLINKDKAQIIETSKYQDSPEVSFAMQSGPLLVYDDKINSSFSKKSNSKYIRSGVGVVPNGSIIFAISNEPITFYDFALFFKENLGCHNALYLDGAISEMYVQNYRENTEKDFSVIIGITER